MTSPDCLAETGVDPADLPFYATDAGGRGPRGVPPSTWAPTGSTCTARATARSYVQTYAAAHPNRVHSLLLDGPVDLTRSGFDYYAEDARAFRRSS